MFLFGYDKFKVFYMEGKNGQLLSKNNKSSQMRMYKHKNLR